MTLSKFVALCGVLAAVGLSVVGYADAQQTCTGTYSQDNNANGAPCQGATVEPQEAGKPRLVAGVLTGGTTSLDVPNSSNGPGSAQLQINLAGNGQLVLTAGNQTVLVKVDEDGTT